MDVSSVQETIERLAGQVGPAVVGLGRGWGVGSGVVIAPGRVLTCAHNLRGEEPTMTFGDGHRESATIAGVDEDRDIAVLDVATADIEGIAWDPAESSVGIGAPLVAVANPGGRGLRATLGFATADERSFRGPRGRRLQGAIEHTAPLPRGSSGAPLVDTAGRLVGLNAVRLDGGLILALPADAAAKERVELLARGERPAARRLGLAIAPPRAARRMRRAVGLPERSGLLVRAVEEDGPAARAGVERGDLLVGAAGEEIDGIDALHGVLDGLAADASLELAIVRGAEERQVTVEFGTAGAAAAAE
jgi:serine protease Do